MKIFRRNEKMIESDVSKEELLSLYLESKNDYRNALNLEQTILNFGVALLALGLATGFIMWGKIISWIIFSVIIPFMISMVKILFIHQKHRSKTYKMYQLHLEIMIAKIMPDFPGYELWKKNHLTSFVLKRSGFKVAYWSFMTCMPYIFLAMGILSYPIMNRITISFSAIFFFIAIGCDVVCFKYYRSISNLEDV